MSGLRLIAALCVLPALIAAAAPGGADDPAAYAVRARVAPVPGALLHRLDLPAGILAAARTADVGDLRLFDADGQALPIARTAPAPAPLRRETLRPLPILAPANLIHVTGVALRLDAAGQPRVATMTGAPAAAAPAVIGYLLDARRIAGEAGWLTLTADPPPGQPVTFIVEAGVNLGTWRPLAETVAYRAPGTAPAPVVIPLSGAALAGGYLRVGWRSATGLLAPVTIRSATLSTRPTGDGDVAAEGLLPAPAGGGPIDIAVPFATPIAWVCVIPAGRRVTPVRILGRATDEQPWTILGSGIAGTPAPIALGGATPAMLRIEAAGGIDAPATIRFGFAPRALLFLATGRPPYTLAAGRAGTGGGYLPRDALGASGGAPAAARIAAPAARLRLAPPAPRGMVRQVLLWSILLAATLALAGMAWLLWRSQRGEPAARA